MNSEYTPTEEELTAYVLGECDDIQTKAIETAVAAQAETAELLEAIRETVELSAGLYSAVSGEALSDEQRAELTSAAENVVPLTPKRRTFTLAEGLVAVAVLGVVSSIVLPQVNNAIYKGGGEYTNEEMYIAQSPPEAVDTLDTDVRYDQNSEALAQDYTRLESEHQEQINKGGNISGRNPAQPSKSGAMLLAGPSANYQAPSTPAPEPNYGDGITFIENDAKSAEEPEEWLPEDELPSASAANNFEDVSKSKDDASRAKLKPQTKPATPAPVESFSVITGANTNLDAMKILPEGADGSGIKPYNQVAPKVEESIAVVVTSPPPAAGKPMQTARSYGRQEQLEKKVVSGNSTELYSIAPQQFVDVNGVARGGRGDSAGNAGNEDGRIMEFGFEVDNIEPRRLIASAPPQDIYRPVPKPQPVTPGTEAYDRIIENKFKRVAQAPLSTFSIDVDTASYSNMRRFLSQGQMPPVDSVRVEELINYFNYDYPQPKGEDPFSANIEVAAAPWNPQHKLVRVGLKGKDIVSEERPASNLVFLLDVSGSMSDHNKLPLVKQSIQMLTKQLTNRDRVAIVVYAGNSGLVLPSTPGNRHQDIVSALERLNAGGSTNGGAGIELAYRVASENFIKGGVNRVILATDGDFNVGNTSRGGLVSQIESSAKSGVFLSVLGFGMGNLKDATMENLADKGNGNYAYIDTFHEAKKVLVDQMNGTLYTIAKDVKIQVEFNPNRIQSYRLIGYENRVLANRDFNDDTKDAGEIGAGHTVTALYELVPKGLSATMPQRGVDNLRYKAVQEEAIAKPQSDVAFSQELMTVKLRYKQPEGHTSKLLEFHVEDVNADYNESSKDFKFASAVAVFGMKLRNSPFAHHLSYDDVLKMAEGGMGHDLNGYRTEFTGLVRKAKSMNPQPVYYPEEVIR